LKKEMFFFEKKNQKTFAHCFGAGGLAGGPGSQRWSYGYAVRVCWFRGPPAGGRQTDEVSCFFPSGALAHDCSQKDAFLPLMINYLND
jgi:hypothetical protein